MVSLKCEITIDHYMVTKMLNAIFLTILHKKHQELRSLTIEMNGIFTNNKCSLEDSGGELSIYHLPLYI